MSHEHVESADPHHLASDDALSFPLRIALMDKFARIIVGYYGCPRDFSDALLLGKASVADWKKSQNGYDWLGEGVYFWEHSPSEPCDRRKRNMVGQLA